MHLLPIIPFAHTLLRQAVQKGDIVVDGTVGNGHDTLFLAKLVGKDGKVYGFDIQEQAIHTTFERLKTEGEEKQVVLFQRGHEHISESIPTEHHGNIAAAIYNLGYLPKGDKSIITKPETTIASVEQLLKMLKRNGIIVLVIYHGHEGGKEERDALLHYVTQLEQEHYHVLKYSFINQKNYPPFIIAIEKK